MPSENVDFGGFNFKVTHDLNYNLITSSKELYSLSDKIQAFLLKRNRGELLLMGRVSLSSDKLGEWVSNLIRKWLPGQDLNLRQRD